MKLRNVRFRQVFTLLIVSLVLLFFCQFTGIGSAYAQDENEADIQEVFRTLELIREEYISKVDPYDLLEGAVKGMKDYLKLKKFNREGLEEKVIDRNRTLAANLRALKGAYGKVLMFNRNKISENALVYAAIKGMMEVIQKKFEDPYTIALDPEEYSMFKEQLNSQGYSGIGAFIELDKKHNNTLMIVEPIEDAPADKAGLKPGDYILRINGVSTRGMSLEAASNRIRGPVKTPVTLHIKRGKKRFDVKILRDTVTVNSVKYKMIDDIGYIKLRSFGETTIDEMKEALNYIESSGAKGLILDLRNNGGGYIVTAIQVCSQFIKKDKIVTSVVNYRKGTKDVHRSVNSGRITLPLAILINKFSASASEITAGCIQDHHAGILIGEKTFGKGSVQTVRDLTGGGAIKYTTAHYLTPKGRDIDKIGIEPDVKIEMDTANIGSDNDIQLQEALKYIHRKVSKK